MTDTTSILTQQEVAFIKAAENAVVPPKSLWHNKSVAECVEIETIQHMDDDGKLYVYILVQTDQNVLFHSEIPFYGVFDEIDYTDY